MRQLPTGGQYSGLTIVLSNPSRFDRDNKELLSAYAGHFVNDILNENDCSRYICDIRTSDTAGDGLLEGTKGILLLGDKAFNEWTDYRYRDYSLGEQRGYSLINKYSLPCIASYFPQDAIDIVDHETRLNPQLSESGDDDDKPFTSEDDDETDADTKRHGKTARSNFRFWLRRDIIKILWAIRAGAIPSSDYTIKAYPSSLEVIKLLSEAQGRELYLDIETDLEAQNLLCIGFSFDWDTTVYVVPFLRYDYTLAYSDYYNILRALSKALRRNLVIIHNAMFDLGVLSFKYSLPIPRQNYCTMLSQHRCFPEAEKSLGHSMSCWPDIWEPFHKDEGVFPPNNMSQEQQLWKYNAKDVWAMKLIKRAQLMHAVSDAGLWQSIMQSNRSIYSFLMNTFTGMMYDNEMVASIQKNCDRLMTHYLRAIRTLVGHDVLPTSPKQCRDYFFRDLGYQSTMKTKKGYPATGEDALQKLKLKYPLNAVIDFMLVFRERAKENGMLKFTPLPCTKK